VPYDNVTGSMPNSLYTNEFIELWTIHTH
jgi:hypothetical protein